MIISDFACKHVDLIRTLVKNDNCQSLLSRNDYFSAVRQLNIEMPQTSFMRELRRFRNSHFLRLLLLDIAKSASTEEIMRSWSDCADAIILQTLSYCQHHLLPQYGSPLNKEYKLVELLTIAMGKLGGRELNYSSDIDLIFTFSEAGYTDGSERITNDQYFYKVIQHFIKILQIQTVDGFVFRVDLRLRPNGDSGPLVGSLTALETYYQEQGREWERYAMVKARVITEDIHAPNPGFEHLILPFVYRRYVDFGVIESLRSMKSLIEREVQLNPRLNDIKRGQGGIREIEFIIQNFQLIRGGRLPQLQEQNAMLALSKLKQEQVLPSSNALKKAYLFLRQLENALQMRADEQTHSLPDEPSKRAQISLSMNYPNWETLFQQLQKYRRIISHSFQSILGRVDAYEDEHRVLAKQLAGLWQGHIEQESAINLLTSLGYQNASHCFQMIHAFRHSPRCRRLSQASRLRLDKFIVLLLTELIHCDKTDEVLLQMMHLLENIIGRSHYLALLTENPKALQELLFWFASSPFITGLLVSSPFLLDILLNGENQWQIPSRYQLQALLDKQLAHRLDYELQEEILREFKLSHWLMAARAELQGFYSAIRVGQFLSDLAEIILVKGVAIAYEQLKLRYPKIQAIKSGFAIIAYGKLGSRELNYLSDLDLVFLHTAQAEEEALVTRLTQKIMHQLTTRTQTGILYAVDTRLRPSGSAGLLVSHVDAFINYQQKEAWVWEHQALLKARIVVGSRKMKERFLQLKQFVLDIPRDPQKLQQEVLLMRSKINLHQDLKKIRGELLDLEFLVQFLILKSNDPSLARFTNSLSQIHRLLLLNHLTKAQGLILKKKYKHIHHLLHQNILQPGIYEDFRASLSQTATHHLINSDISKPSSASRAISPHALREGGKEEAYGEGSNEFSEVLHEIYRCT